MRVLLSKNRESFRAEIGLAFDRFQGQKPGGKKGKPPMRQAHLFKTRASLRAILIAICGGALLAFTAGCGSDPKPPPQTAQTQPTSTTQSTGAPMQNKKTDQTIN